MSNRKRRGRAAETASGAKPQPAENTEGKTVLPARPPRRNITMLSASSILLVIWILFLVYVALFG